MLSKFCIVLVLLYFKSSVCNNGELFGWNIFTYKDTPKNDTYKIRGNNYYIPENNIPTGISPYYDKLFISIARTNFGIPSTLNYIDFRDNRNNISPSIKAYPDYETNELHSDLSPDNKRIISVYRTRIDECNRLWFVDTGVIEIDPPIIIQQSSIWIIDIRTAETVQRIDIPVTLYNNMPSGFVSINVDVDLRHCSEAYAYIPNTYSNVLIVYSLKENKIWSFSDVSFSPDTDDTSIHFNKKFNSGVYSVALSVRNKNKTRNIYYHSLRSYKEYKVSNTYLKAVPNSIFASNGSEFRYFGYRGIRSQSGMHDIDTRSGVMFFTQLQENSIKCWNTEISLSPQNTATVTRNDATLTFPVDIKVDNLGHIWYLSNKLPTYNNKSNINKNELNFFVHKRNLRSLINFTVCDNSIFRSNFNHRENEAAVTTEDINDISTQTTEQYGGANEETESNYVSYETTDISYDYETTAITEHIYETTENTETYYEVTETTENHSETTEITDNFFETTELTATLPLISTENFININQTYIKYNETIATTIKYNDPTKKTTEKYYQITETTKKYPERPFEVFDEALEDIYDYDYELYLEIELFKKKSLPKS